MVSGRHQDRKTVKAKQRVRLCEGLLWNSSPKAFYLLTLAMLMKGKLKRTWLLKAPSGTRSELLRIRPGLFLQFCLVTHAAFTGRVVALGMCTNARTAHNFFTEKLEKVGKDIVILILAQTVLLFQVGITADAWKELQRRSLHSLQKGCENISLALFGEGTPNFMKSHFSLEGKKWFKETFPNFPSAWGWANYAVLKVNTA